MSLQTDIVQALTTMRDGNQEFPVKYREALGVAITVADKMTDLGASAKTVGVAALGAAAMKLHELSEPVSSPQLASLPFVDPLLLYLGNFFIQSMERVITDITGPLF